MFANWFFGKGQKSRAARSTRAQKDVLRRRNRLLQMESLEDRSLLSISTGLSDLSALSSPTALYASATPAATATQLAMHLPSQVTGGVPVTVEMAALDAHGHFVFDYTGTVNLTSTDSGATFTQNGQTVTSVTFKQGFAMFQVTFSVPTQAQSESVIATDSVNSLTNTATTTVEVPAVATQLAVYLPAQVSTGVAVPLQLAAQSAQDQFVPNYSGTVNLWSSDSGATFTQNGQTVTSVTFVHGFASLEVTFANTGAQTVTATDGSTASITGSATTTVATPAAVAGFTFHLPKTVSTGQAVTVQVTATDAQGNPVPTYTGTANLSSSDKGATFTQNGQTVTSVAFTGGVAVFQVTFANTGAQTVSLADSVTASITGSASTTVAAADVATHFGVFLPPNVPSGTAIPMQIAAFDAQNHPVFGYTGTVNLSSTDPGAVFTQNGKTVTSITLVNGTAGLDVTFAATGSQTVTATDSVTSTLTGSATTTVATPAVATHFGLYLPANVPTGVAVPVQIVPLDAQNNPVPNYSGTVDLSSTDNGAVFTQNGTTVTSITFNPATAITPVEVTFANAGAQTVTATDSVTSTLTGSATTTVVNPAVATHFAVILPQKAYTNVAVPVQVVALDADNHVVSGDTDTVNLSSSDPGAVFTQNGTTVTSVALVSGSASVQVTFVATGSQTVTATDSVTATLDGSATTVVTAPAAVTHFGVFLPPNVSSGVPVPVQIVPLDAQNDPVPSYSGTVDLSSTDSGAVFTQNGKTVTSITFTPTATANGTTAAPVVEVTFANAGAQTVTATDSVTASLTGSATTTVAAPVVATHFALYLPPKVPSGVPVTVLIVPLDAQNNPVPNYSGTVDLASSPDKAVFTQNGQTITSISFVPVPAAILAGLANPVPNPVAFQVTFATPSQPLQTITATDSVTATLTGSATTTVTAPAVATHFILTMPPQVPTGVAVLVQITALDANNHFVPNYDGTVNLTSSPGTAVFSQNGQTVTSIVLNQGSATFDVTLSTLGSDTITATDSGNFSITGTVTTSVMALPPPPPHV
jgi:uncharacterized protein YkuJ/predicted RNA-binding protein YlqC (UPF0109 family)